MQKDQGGLIAIILAALVFVGSGVAWYLNYDEVMKEGQGLKAQLAAEKVKKKDAQDKFDKMKRFHYQGSDLLGMQPGMDERTSLLAMMEHLNLWARRFKALGIKSPDGKDYGQWKIDETGMPVLDMAEGGNIRELTYLKDNMAPRDTRMANETDDQKTYLVAKLEEETKKLEAEAVGLEGQAVEAIKVHDENVGNGTTTGKLGQLVEEKSRRIQELRDSIRNVEEQIIRNTRESEVAIADAEKAIRLKLDELDGMKAKQEKAALEKKKKIQELTDRVFAIATKRQLARESTEADGMVINAVADQHYAWIDVGRRDALLKGTRFEVFAMNKGGRKTMKGMALVIEVHEHYSVIQLLRDGIVQLTPTISEGKVVESQVIEGKVVEKGNVVEITERNGTKQLVPVTRVQRLDYLNTDEKIEKGDYVANEVFDRKKAKTFVFGGKLRGRYTNEQMAKLIGEFGGDVAVSVESETTYLVIGADYDKDPNFEKAKSLGVKIIREFDLYEMLGIAH